jgi:hypothetical protein
VERAKVKSGKRTSRVVSREEKEAVWAPFAKL